MGVSIRALFFPAALFVFLIATPGFSATTNAPAASHPAPAANAARPADGVPAPNQTVTVGVAATPPFAFRDETGKWTGFAIDLWEAMAPMLHVKYKYVDVSLSDLIPDTVAKQIDIGIGEQPITAEAEEQVDFTHTYYSSDLAIGVTLRTRYYDWRQVWRDMVSQSVISISFFILLASLAAGTLVWYFERHHNPAHFGGRPVEGIGSGWWWSIVTVMTIGYGDKTPVTFGGRATAIFLMIISMVAVACLTAGITSALTTSRITSDIHSPRDLVRCLVSAVKGGPGAKYLNDANINTVLYATPAEAIAAVINRDSDACVMDEAILRYYAKAQFSGQLDVLPFSFHQSNFAMILPNGSPWREDVNAALLKVIQSPEWGQIRSRYLAR